MAQKESDKNRKKMWPGKCKVEQDKWEHKSFAKHLTHPESQPNLCGALNKCGKQLSFQWNHPLPGSTSVSLTSPSSTSTTVVSTTAPISFDRQRSANVLQPPLKSNRKMVQVQLKELGLPSVVMPPPNVERTSTPPQELRLPPQFLSALAMSPLPPPPGMNHPTTTTTLPLPKIAQQQHVTSESLRITPKEPSTSRQKITNPQQESRGETTRTQTDRRSRETKQDGSGSRCTSVEITVPQGNSHMPPSNVTTTQTITPTTTALSAPSTTAKPWDTTSQTLPSVSTPHATTTSGSRPLRLQRRAPSEIRSSKEDTQRTATAETKSPMQISRNTLMPILSSEDSQATLIIDQRQTSSNSPIVHHNWLSAEEDAMNFRQEKLGTKETTMRSTSPIIAEHQRNPSPQKMAPVEMRPTTIKHTPPPPHHHYHHHHKKDDTLYSQHSYEREPVQKNDSNASSSATRSPSPPPPPPPPQQFPSVPMRQRRPIRYVKRRYPPSPAMDRRHWPVLRMSSAASHEDRRRFMNAQAQEEWKWGMASGCYGQRSLSLVTQGVLVPLRQSHYLHDDMDRNTTSLESTIALMSTEKSVPDVDVTCPWEASAAARREDDRCVNYTELAARALAKVTGRRGMTTMRADAGRFTERERLLRRKEAEVERRREELQARAQDLDAFADKLDQRYHNITRSQKAFDRALQHSCFQSQNEENDMTKYPRRSRLDSRRVGTSDGGESAARTLHLILRYADERMLERIRVGIACALAFYACEHDLPYLLRELYQRLEVCADLRDKRGFTLLHAAAAKGAVGAANILLFEMGAHLWETTASGTTRGECGAGDVCNGGGGVEETAMDLALAGGHEDMVRFLADVDANMEMVESGDGREDDEGGSYATNNRRWSKDRFGDDTVGGGNYADGFEHRVGKWQRDNPRRPNHRSLSNPFDSGPGPAKRFKGSWNPFVAGSSAWRDDYD